MSRIFIMVSKPHNQLMPVLSISTGDHTGGSYSIGGLHPSTIAKLAGHGPKVEIKEGERFDLRCFANKKRIAFVFVINTTKHFPHVNWSSSDGLAALPLGLHQYAPAFLLKPEPKPGLKANGNTKDSSGRVHRRDRRSSRSTASSASGRRQRDEYETEDYDGGYDCEKGYDRESDRRPQIKAGQEGDEKVPKATKDKSKGRPNSRRAIEQKHDGQMKDRYGIEQTLVRQRKELYETDDESDSEYDRVQEKRHSRKPSPQNSDNVRHRKHDEYQKGYDRRSAPKSSSYTSDDRYDRGYDNSEKNSERRRSRTRSSRGSDYEYDSRYDKYDRKEERRHPRSYNTQPDR